jgi:hypothetical protein
MAVWALAWLGAALPEPRLEAAAIRAGRFLLERVGVDGRLERAWRDGQVSGAETLEDVAWVAAGWLQLHEVTGEAAWLQAATDLVERRLPHYLDGDVLFDTPDDGPALVLRPRGGMDGATPSPAAVTIQVLTRLAALTGDDRRRATAERLCRADGLQVTRVPEAFATLLAAAGALAAPPRSVAVVGDPGSPATAGLHGAALRGAPSDAVVLLGRPGTTPGDSSPLLVGKVATGREPLAYLCESATCHPPLGSSQELSAALADLRFILDS